MDDYQTDGKRNKEKKEKTDREEITRETGRIGEYLVYRQVSPTNVKS